MTPILLTEKRLRASGSTNLTLSVSSLSDRARFIYSASFRRLQMKAQVFSLESNAAVRSRFSHSAEVAHIGIFIVTKIIEILNKKKSEEIHPELQFLLNNIIPFIHTVETSCLIHDVGNPPFGHFGEAAITKWFEDNQKYLLGVLSESSENRENNFPIDDFFKYTNYNDFLNFDGNPQGFRIISHLQGFDEYGLNLSLSLLAATMKYVSSNNEINDSHDITKKMGYFSTEKNIVRKIRDGLNIQDKCRHPLVYLMEAADDISYCISDIEDAIEKNICSYRDFFTFFQKRIPNELQELENPFITSALECITSAISIANEEEPNRIELPKKFMLFKTNITNFCVEEVSNDFISNITNYLKGTENSIIKKGTITYSIQKIFKEFTQKFVFSSDEAELIELSGYSVIYGLLDKFRPLLSLSCNKFNQLIKNSGIRKSKLDLHKRLFNRLPSKHVNCYKLALTKLDNNDVYYQADEFNLRSHLIIDYISGMTDSFALEVYQALEGIKVKHDGC